MHLKEGSTYGLKSSPVLPCLGGQRQYREGFICPHDKGLPVCMEQDGPLGWVNLVLPHSLSGYHREWEGWTRKPPAYVPLQSPLCTNVGGSHRDANMSKTSWNVKTSQNPWRPEGQTAYSGSVGVVIVVGGVTPTQGDGNTGHRAKDHSMSILTLPIS
jgi:hypothetical protein